MDKYLTISFLVTTVVALIIPPITTSLDIIFTILFVLQIFCICFNFELPEIKNIKKGTLITFYLSRFIFLPLIALSLNSTLAFFFILPAGTSTPAIAWILAGNVSLALTIMTFASCLSPLFLQLLLNPLHIDFLPTIYSLSLFLGPALFHIPFRRYHFVKNSCNKLITPLLLITIFLATNAQRDFVLTHSLKTILMTLTSFGIYIGLYLCTWWWMYKEPREDRISFALTSTFNNINLGIILASLYCSTTTQLFMLTANISWTLAFIFCHCFYRFDLLQQNKKIS